VTVPTLLITGPVGVGKTSVAFELIEVLEEHDVPHTFFDVDNFSYFHPKPEDDPFGERFALKAVATLFPELQSQGVERLILARVLWERDSLKLYEAAIPDAVITVVRLTAPLPVIEERLRRRELGAGLAWHLDRAAELDAHWRAHPVEDLLVETADRSVRSIALEIASAVAWI
jgi:DNA polymerase III delta prime subunit